MARANVIYNCQGLFVGPAPETDYNFIAYTGGAPTNDHSNLYQQLNRLHSIDRVQSVSYSINVPYTNVTQINKRGIVDRAIVNYPTVSLNFNYLLCGTKNEARLGFNVNYPQFEFGFNEESYYSDNLDVSLLSGFYEEDKNRKILRPGSNFAVNQYRDCRNFYVAVNQEGDDLDKPYFKENFAAADIHQGIDPNAPNYHVIGFGNCYLQSYSTQGAVGELASASASYTSYNVNFTMSGSGFKAPDIDAKTGTPYDTNEVVIPRILANEGYPALKAGDISITTDSFSGLGVDFNKLHIQSYNIDINLNKQPLPNMGYRFPVDNRPDDSVLANLSIRGIVESGNSGSLADLVEINSGYDFTIKVNPTRCAGSTAAPINAGAIPIERGDEALRYSVVGAKLENFGYSTSIGENKVFDASFSVEINPDDRTNGFFISGVLGAEKIEDFVLLESGVDDGFYLQQETDDLLVTNLVPPY